MIRVELDLIEELRLRRWARENYAPSHLRDGNWPAVVLDEMQRRDAEQLVEGGSVARRLAPLATNDAAFSGVLPPALAPHFLNEHHGARELHYG